MKVRMIAATHSSSVLRGRFRYLVAPALFAPIALAGACGGDEKNAASANDAKQAVEVRSIAVTHEPCEDAGKRVDSFDADGDGKPDVRKVFDGAGREICRTSDLNHDGKVDLYEYYGPGGETRRREASYVDSGDVTSIEIFESGKRVRRELDTSGQRRIDTWDYFDPASGARTKRERDVNGDGKIDQWWMWEGDKVTIAIDKTNDGRPDPEATVVVGGAPASSAPPGPAAPPPPPSPAASAAAAPAATSATTPASTTADAGAPPVDVGTKKPKGGKAK